MPYAWMLTKEIPGESDPVVGPSAATMTAAEIQSHPRAREFRLLDDDGEVMAEGFIVTDPDDEGGETDFAPLDDYGEGGLGATEIQYKVAGVWETL